MQSTKPQPRIRFKAKLMPRVVVGTFTIRKPDFRHVQLDELFRGNSITEYCCTIAVMVPLMGGQVSLEKLESRGFDCFGRHGGETAENQASY